MTFAALLDQLPDAFAADLSRSFASVIASNPTETFYGLATCHDTDTYSCYLAAHSEEAILRELQQRSNASGTPISELSSDRYWVPEWQFTDESGLVRELHSQIWNAFEREGIDYYGERRRVYDAYVEGLRRFEANGGISNYDRERFLLVPWVHDPGDENVWVLEAVERLNPKHVSELFASTYGYT